MKLNLTRPIVFFDLETTGINVGADRIVEITMLKINPDGSEEEKTFLVNPGIPIPPEVTEIHGISDKDVKDAPSFKELAHECNAFMEGCDLSGYNLIRFDIPLLAEEFLRAELDFEVASRKIVDVQNIFHKMEPRTLKAAYKFYCGMKLEDAHSSRADTFATYEVLKAQLEKYDGEAYEDRDGIVSYPVVNDVDKLHQFSFITNNVDLAGHIVFNDKQQEVFNFGKYKGRPVEEVFTREPSYYDWMMKSQFPLYTKKIITSIKLRGFNQGSNRLLNL